MAPSRKNTFALSADVSADVASSPTDEELIASLDECAQTIPPNLDYEKDCVNLALGGSGSQSLYNLFARKSDNQEMQDYFDANPATYKWARHDHKETVVNMHEQGATCFVLTLREPAARIESFYKDSYSAAYRKLGTGTVPEPRLTSKGFTQNADSLLEVIFDPDSRVERSLALDHCKGCINLESTLPGDARSIHTQWYTTNTSRTDEVKGFQIDTPNNQFVWGQYKRNIDAYDGDMDTSLVNMEPYTGESAGTKAWLPPRIAPLDCPKLGIHIKHICLSTLDTDFKAWEAAIKTGQTTRIPSGFGLNADWSPAVNVSHYVDSSFIISDDNRRLINEVLYRQDMMVYRHYCGPNQ